MANNAAATTSSILDEPVDYRDLKKWIEQQEANPRPLSPLQQRAIADLRRSIEPDIGDSDWISLLNRYNQARGGTASFTDERSPDDRFVSRCDFRHISGAAEPLSFPNPEAGFVPNETGALVAPAFGRKKDAKRYAAKCCVEWLMKGDFMPSDGVNVEFARGTKTKPTPAAATARAVVTTTGTPTAAANPAPVAQMTAGPAPPPAAAAGGGDDDDEVPATKRVEDLCRTMGLVVPQYRVTASSSSSSSSSSSTPANTHFFDGHADFGPDAIKVPQNLGCVTNVYGRKNARERVAEEVLLWLVEEEKRRLKEVELLMADMKGGAAI